MGVWLSAPPRNSAGAYVVSEPTTSVPFDLIAAGTCDASESSFWTVLGSKLAEAEPDPAGLAPPPDSDALVQAVSARALTARTTAPLAASFAEKVICRPLLGGTGNQVLKRHPS